jgi:hypothetical protein
LYRDSLDRTESRASIATVLRMNWITEFSPSVTLRRSMIISKATSVYVIMVAVLVGGLWLILAMGSTLVPPTDLAGKWELTEPAGTHELSVEQSGKFVNLVMDKWSASLKIKASGSQSTAGQNSIVMTGNGQTVTFAGLGINDHCTIRFDGATTGVYQAHRIFKTFR